MFEFHAQRTVANHFLAELRDVEKQQDPHRFRRNLKRLGTVMAYELSKKLDYSVTEVPTPLGRSTTELMGDRVVLSTILRAGLPFYDGFLEVFDYAETAFIGAYRSAESALGGVQIEMDYMAAPGMQGKVLVLIDPMLATGKSLLKAYQALTERAKPKKVFVAAAIASKPGVDFIAEHLPEAHIFVGAIDPELNDKAYIVPGLGDAGDLAFGKKL